MPDPTPSARSGPDDSNALEPPPVAFGPCPACDNWGIEVPAGFPPDELEQLIIAHDREDHPGALPALAERQRELLQRLVDAARGGTSGG